MAHHEDHALLKAYVAAWSKFYVQCDYLPLPFYPLELSEISGNNQKIKDENCVRKVGSCEKFLLIYLLAYNNIN